MCRPEIGGRREGESGVQPVWPDPARATGRRSHFLTDTANWLLGRLRSQDYAGVESPNFLPGLVLLGMAVAVVVSAGCLQARPAVTVLAVAPDASAGDSIATDSADVSKVNFTKSPDITSDCEFAKSVFEVKHVYGGGWGYARPVPHVQETVCKLMFLKGILNLPPRCHQWDVPFYGPTKEKSSEVQAVLRPVFCPDQNSPWLHVVFGGQVELIAKGRREHKYAPAGFGPMGVLDVDFSLLAEGDSLHFGSLEQQEVASLKIDPLCKRATLSANDLMLTDVYSETTIRFSFSVTCPYENIEE